MNASCGTGKKGVKALFYGLLLMTGAIWMAGCDDHRGEGDFDYDPPSGYGALILDNQSSTDINLYVDGSYAGRIGDYDDEHFDLEPGLHRLVLDEHHGDRTWGGDVDVLEGRLTIISATVSHLDSHDYRVSVEFD